MGEVEWTPHESALWATCEIMRDWLVHGSWPDPIPYPFARQVDHSEQMIHWGDYQRSWFGAAGDGSYDSSTFFLGGFGAAGMALGAATLGASAIGNAGRKSRARRDATEMWRPIDSGHLYVSTHGYYILPSTGGIFCFPQSSLLQADLGGPGVLLATHSMDGGHQSQFAITTVWAELLFVMWAHEYSPHHPRLTNLGFLPPEFIQRVEYSGVWEQSPLKALTDGR
ncbi:MAG: hypothetical protein ACYC2O_03765 [Microthrixaceae bacterium]